MSRAIIDKSQVAANQRRAASMAVDGADFLLARALDDLADRLAHTHHRFDRAIVVGPYGNRVAERLVATGKVKVADPVPTGDGEVIEVEAMSADLAVSMMHLHHVDDVAGALIQMRRALRPDGLLLACAPAAGTLKELRASLIAGEAQVTGGVRPRVMPFMDVRDAGSLLQRAGLALPVTDTDEVVVRYDTALDLMRDLRAMGATNVLLDRPRCFTPRAVLMQTAAHYAEHHADPDGRVRATFGFVWMSGWAPDESQPKPLKPGSATKSLAEALGDRSDAG